MERPIKFAEEDGPEERVEWLWNRGQFVPLVVSAELLMREAGDALGDRRRTPEEWKDRVAQVRALDKAFEAYLDEMARHDAVEELSYSVETEPDRSAVIVPEGLPGAGKQWWRLSRDEEMELMMLQWQSAGHVR
jgi:hypothetical protein